MTFDLLGRWLPCIITAIVLDRALGLYRHLKRYLNALKVASGLPLKLIGVLVYTGELQRLSKFGSAGNAVFIDKVEENTIQLFDDNVLVSDKGARISESTK